MSGAARVLGCECDGLLPLQMLKDIASDGMQRLLTAEERVTILLEVRELALCMLEMKQGMRNPYPNVSF